MAGRTHGRNARIYIDTAATPSAAGAFNATTATSFLASWSLDQSVDTVEITSFGDTSKVMLSGLPSANGSMSGFVNLGTATFKNVIGDTNQRTMYLYPDAATTSVYGFCTATFGGSYSGGVGDAIKVDLTYSASTPWIWSGNL